MATPLDMGHLKNKKGILAQREKLPEWEVELNTLLNNNQESDDELFDAPNEKITALYGEENVNMSIEDLMNDEKFSAIPEFLRSEVKKIKCKKASDLMNEIRCYVEVSVPGRCYWPIVKSVTIKVPNCEDFLEYIVLVDLPGTGDCNKSRDQMWRSKLRECSSVWIVSEITRAVSKKEAWKLVSNSITDMAQEGECRSLSFICTKTDQIEDNMSCTGLKDEDFQITPKDSQYDKGKYILATNEKAKKMVEDTIKRLSTFKKHFNCNNDFLSVFTVSSKAFIKKDKILTPEETEIPNLKGVLKTYNNSLRNQITSDYISGALGILYLIQAFKESDIEMMKTTSSLHEINLDKALEPFQEYSDQIYRRLEELLAKGAENSEIHCVEAAKKIIKPKNGQGFHRTLTALCKSDGFCRSRNGETDLNRHLAKQMLQQIEVFDSFFLVQENATEKSLQEIIDEFTIIPEDINCESSTMLSYMQKFLKTEETKLKTTLKDEIVEKKKSIHASPSESIKTTMLPCYQRAAQFSGKGSMNERQEMLLGHIETKKKVMFQMAKTKMLDELRKTLNDTKENMRTELIKSMEYSLLDANTLFNMDVTKEIEEMEALKESAED